MSIVSSNTAITHTFGNVACVVMDYVKSYFSPDFFNTEHISTKMSYKQLDVFRAKREFWKNKKPMLILKPRIEMDDSSKGFYGSAMTNRVTNNKLNVEFMNTVPVIKDDKYGIMLRLGWTRLKLYFDIAIVVETYNQQMNLAHSLNNDIVPQTPTIVKTCLESCIPKGVIVPLQKHLGCDVTDTANTLKYMNTYGVVPFTYKLKDSSGMDEYFMLYDTNLEIIMSDISLDDGDKRGLIADTYTINMAMSVEFYAVGTWFLMLKDAQHDYIMNPSDAELVGKDANERIIPLLSIPMRFDLHLEDGWRIMQSPVFVVTSNGVGEQYKDVTPFGTILTDDVKTMITNLVRHNRSIGLPISPYLRFRMFKGTREMTYGKTGFEIDLDTFEIITYDCTPGISYRLFILINNVAIHSITPEVQKFHEER